MTGTFGTARVSAHYLLIIALVFLLCPRSPGEQSPSRADEIFRLGVKQLEVGNLNASAPFFFEAVKTSKNQGQAALRIAQELRKYGYNGPAITFLEIAIEHSPRDGQIARLLGDTYLKVGDFSQALRNLLLSEELLPPSPRPELQRDLAYALAGLHRFDKAEKRARQAIRDAEELVSQGKRVDPLRFRLLLARVYVLWKRYPQALAELETTLNANPPDDVLAECYLDRAESRQATGDLRGATIDFERHLALSPRSAEGHYRFALFLIRTQKHERVRPLLERTLELEPNHESSCYNLARMLLRTGEKKKGAQLLERYKKLAATRRKAQARLNSPLKE